MHFTIASHSAGCAIMLSLRIPVHSGHSRQSEKCHIHFLDRKTPKLMAVISFLTHSAGKLVPMFFPSQNAIMPPTEEPLCPSLLRPDTALCWRRRFVQWVETSPSLVLLTKSTEACWPYLFYFSVGFVLFSN